MSISPPVLWGHLYFHANNFKEAILLTQESICFSETSPYHSLTFWAAGKLAVFGRCPGAN